MNGTRAFNQNQLLSVTGATEAATGLVLVVAPSLLVELLLVPHLAWLPASPSVFATLKL